MSIGAGIAILGPWAAAVAAMCLSDVTGSGLVFVLGAAVIVTIVIAYCESASPP